MYVEVQGTIQSLDAIRSQICDLKNPDKNLDQLRRLKDLFLMNFKNMLVLEKHFTFGQQNTHVNLSFQWVDSFSRTKSDPCPSALLDAYSCLYNFGACCSKIACLVKEERGDSMREASYLFQVSAWIFEHLRTLVHKLDKE